MSIGHPIPGIILIHTLVSLRNISSQAQKRPLRRSDDNPRLSAFRPILTVDFYKICRSSMRAGFKVFFLFVLSTPFVMKRKLGVYNIRCVIRNISFIFPLFLLILYFFPPETETPVKEGPLTPPPQEIPASYLPPSRTLLRMAKRLQG